MVRDPGLAHYYCRPDLDLDRVLDRGRIHDRLLFAFLKIRVEHDAIQCS